MANTAPLDQTSLGINKPASSRLVSHKSSPWFNVLAMVVVIAQGASAEIVAMATIGAAELYGLPVSTTHVLSSGVAGTMAANGSGLQWARGARSADGVLAATYLPVRQ